MRNCIGWEKSPPTSINKVGYPIRFVYLVISSFINNNPTLPPRDINKMSINKFICPKNEKYEKLFLSKLNSFTENKYTFIILWKINTRL